MINSKSDYLRYKQMDAENGTFNINLKEYIFNDIWRFLRALRYAEYIHNTKRGTFWKAYKLYVKFRYKSIGKKLGFSIPMNVFGAGLMLPHYGNIVVNSRAKIGENCKIHIGVNIGADYSDSTKAPVLGNNCYIAPGAKLFGGIILGDNVKIGANAVVNKSFTGNDITLVGVPAKKLNK
ncbi:Serine acetyltransferase [Paraglaciecola mesophila]|uniref:Serine acetyltransferase n=1 Tax=Paraglaciecola mesophila TaxID=197222 RepID=A0A857JHH2_9ALTE|nr:serine acetyltransferase [Paraglaciecola mesophila]QHJ11403.1 Serine acetyltransferase [Paraglaciecola mesophila]